MSVIKQISVYNGTSWDTKDIGVDASNVALGNSIVLTDILPASKLSKNRVVLTDSDQILTTSSITDTNLACLSNCTVNIQNELENKVSKSGDTMTGNLTVLKETPYFKAKSTVLDNKIGTQIPSTTLYYGGYSILDKNNNQTFYTRMAGNQNDKLQQSFVLRRQKSSSGEIIHGFYLGINADETVATTFPSIKSQEAWFNGILPTSTVNCTISSGSGTISLIKIGKFVYAHVNKINTSVAANTVFATIPADYRPIDIMYCPLSFPTDGTMVAFNTNGNIVLNKASSNNLYGACMYITI